MKSHRLYPPQPVFLHRLNVETSYSFNKSSIGSTHLLRVTTQKCNTTKSHYISRRNSGTYTPKNKILLIELIEPLWNYLQQQKLLELTSRQPDSQGYRAIYNSRNYQSLLAFLLRQSQYASSTIVEIIRAYQPFGESTETASIYNSRNYQSLLAQCQLILRITIYNSRNYQSLLAKAEGEAHTAIYNSRNYQNLLAPYRLQRYKKSFKQKHFLYLF